MKKGFFIIFYNMSIDIIFSINVHEKKDFLIKQIKNIDYFVQLNYIIMINANQYMYDELSKCEFIKSKNNIFVNDEYLEKKKISWFINRRNIFKYEKSSK